MWIALFGLGEAGAAIASDLVTAGVEVHAYDPADRPTPEGVTRHENPQSAVVGADVVMSMTAAADAPTALAQAIDAIPADTPYADLATSAAGAKQRLAATAEAAGLRFVDVALMSPVPGKGIRTPALAAGSGAKEFVSLLAPLGMAVEHCGDVAGLAATRKLLRSIVIKGLTALVIESMEAATAAGLAEETWHNLVEQFTAADGAFLRRLVQGTGPHALRRLHEMESTAELLAELDVEPLMTRGTIESLRRVERGAALPVLPD